MSNGIITIAVSSSIPSAPDSGHVKLRVDSLGNLYAGLSTGETQLVNAVKQSGSQVITTGATTVAVVFGTAFPSIPSTPGAMIVEKAASGDANVFPASIDTITTTGFNVNLSSPAPAGAKLHWKFEL